MKKISGKIFFVTIVLVLITFVSRAVLESLLGGECGFWACLFDATPHALVDRITLILGLFFASLVVLYVFDFQRRGVRRRQGIAQRFQRLYEQASLGYLILTMDGKIQDMNQAWLGITGYDRAALLGRSFVDLIVLVEQDAFLQQFILLQKQGWWQDVELHIKRQNGETATIRIDGELVVGDDLQPIVQCIVQDISRYKRTENTLARIGRQSHLLLAAAGDGICGLDNEGRIVFANPAAEQLLGYGVDELMWQSFHEKVFPIDVDGTSSEGHDPIIHTLRTGARSVEEHAYFCHKEGRRIPVQFISTPIQEDGQLMGAVIAFKDISERLRQEEALWESEARYRSLFYNNNSVILMMDYTTGEIVDANQAACDFYGYDFAQLVDFHIYDLSIHSKDEILPLLKEARNTDGYHVEARHQLADGTLRDVEVYSGTVTIGGRDLLYGITHDITERKEAEAAHRLDEARLEALLELSKMSHTPVENIADFVITQGINLTSSTAGVICLFYPDNTMTVAFHCMSGEASILLFDPANLTAEEQSIVRWLMLLQQDQRRPFISNELLPISDLPLADQAEIPVVERYLGIPIVEADRVVVFAAVINKPEPYNAADLRQLRLLVNGMWQLLQQREAQQQAITATLEKERRMILADFIDAASHEFRTPLSVINTSLYMLRKMSDNTLSGYLDTLDEQSAYLSHLVDRMLVLLGLDKAPDSRLVRYNINNILESIENDYRYAFMGADLTLTLALDSTVPDCLGYIQLLHLALIEIVDNALHYSLAGGTTTLATSHRPGWVIVSITDTGIGISADDLPRIFENFYRADKARTKRHAGMGLTIAQRIIEFHNGSVTVESTLGEGSTFQVELPVRLPDNLTADHSPAVHQD